VNHDFLLWVCTAAYSMHIVEEFTLDWRDWARDVLRLRVDWPHFFVVNAAVIVLGVCFAQVGWRLPEMSLMYPAIMIINAIFFHILPTLTQRRFSPGTLTAVTLFLPVGLWTYFGAYADGILSGTTIAVSLVGGALLMASPVVLLRIGEKILKR
jgi:hypothetical protein